MNRNWSAGLVFCLGGLLAACAGIETASEVVNTEESDLATPVEGEAYSAASAGIQRVQGGVGHFDEGRWYCYNNISLSGVTSLKLSVASMSTGGVADIREGGLNGRTLARVTMTRASASWTSYEDMTVAVRPASNAPTQLCFVGISGLGIWNLDKITFQGGASAVFKAGDLIQGEGFAAASAGIQRVEGGVGHLDRGRWYCYDNVNLSGVTGLSMRVAGLNAGGRAEVREGSATGAVLGSIELSPATTTWFDYQPRAVRFARTSTATTRMCVVGASGLGIFNLDALTLLGSAAGNPSGKGPALSPTLLGQNLWYDVSQLWPIVGQSGVKLVRIGGIEFDERPRSLAQYLADVDAIRGIGAEPLVQVSRYQDAAAAAALVRHLNVQNGRRVRYWAIGNEPNLPGHQVSVGAVATYVRSHAVAMRDVDPSLVIYAPDVAWLDANYLSQLIGGAQDITGRDNKGRFFIDGVTFHRYPFGDTYSRADAMGAGAAIGREIQQLRTWMAAANAKHGRTGASALRWGLGEFNISYRNPARNGVGDVGVHSFLNGQFFAEVYGHGMANRADFVATWSVHESGGARVALDLGYLDGPVDNPKPRSSYYHMQMLAKHFRGRFAQGTVNLPNVRAFGAGDSSQLAVMILNMDQEDHDFVVRLDGRAPAQGALRIGIDSGLAVERAGNIDAQATAVLVFDATGKLVRRVDYGINRAFAALPPVETTF